MPRPSPIDAEKKARFLWALRRCGRPTWAARTALPNHSNPVLAFQRARLADAEFDREWARALFAVAHETAAGPGEG